MSEAVSYQRTRSVGFLLIDYPPVNVLGAAVRAGLMRALETALADEEARAIVIACAGRTFSAGADISEFDAPMSEPTLQSVFAAIEAAPKPVVAALHGTALGGGLELALACHYRVADAGAKLGLPEITLGVIPGAGGTQRLPRLIGMGRALDLILTGRQVGAAEALAMGLVNEVVGPDDDVNERALALAAQLAAGPLVAQAYAKAAIDEGLAGTLEDGLAREQVLFAKSFATDDAKVGVESFLAQGPGKATFTGR